MEKLEDTVDLMLSDDYKDRFKAEYWQLALRRLRLFDMLMKEKKGQLDFTLDCPPKLLWKQYFAMCDLSSIYQDRANIEGIDLYSLDSKEEA